MTLRQLSLIVTALLALLLFSSYLAVRAWVLIPYVERQVLTVQRQEMAQVEFLLEGRVEGLESLTQELAQSDRLATTLAAGQRPEQVVAEIPFLDGIYVFNSALELRLVQRFSGVMRDLMESQEAYRRARLMPTLHPQRPRSRSGLLRQKGQLYFYSAASVCRSSGEDCGYGFLVLVRRLDPKLIDFIQARSGMALTLRSATLDDGELERLDRPEAVIKPVSERQVLVMDALDQPAAVISMRHLAQPPSWGGRDEWIALGAIVLLSLLVLLMLWRLLVLPMEHGVAAIRAMERHQQFRSVNSRVRLQEFHQLAKVFNGLMRMLTVQRERMVSLERTDPLTGLPNRTALESFLSHEWRRLRRYRRGLALLLLDIEQFQEFNEDQGYGQGDLVLVRLSRLLKSTSRRGGEMAARYGGDEFALVLTELDEAQLHSLLEHIEQKVAGLPQRDGQKRPIRLSIGVALVPPGVDPGVEELHLSDMMERAESALHGAKQDPDHCWQLWQPEIYEDPVI
ncbi:GGDEF domain-containing protein [Ferrimonas gelatinilytica]|uniref:diguanylate cyclase n=1 Tax=Ferrimonas gelatinilytica TaxID=1255257 RepID=A0ABP9S1Z2_9GAMM